MVIFHSYASLPEGMSWKFVWNIDMNVIGPISGLVQCVQVCHDLPKKGFVCSMAK